MFFEEERKEDDASNEMEQVEEERYSTPYVVKTRLRAMVMNNKEEIIEIERKVKKLIKASIRISLFLNLFVLRCLENNKHIPKWDNIALFNTFALISLGSIRIERKRDEIC